MRIKDKEVKIMKERTYEIPVMEIVRLEDMDIITSSPGINGPDDDFPG